MKPFAQEWREFRFILVVQRCTCPWLEGIHQGAGTDACADAGAHRRRSPGPCFCRHGEDLDGRRLLQGDRGEPSALQLLQLGQDQLRPRRGRRRQVPDAVMGGMTPPALAVGFRGAWPALRISLVLPQMVLLLEK